MPDVASFRAAFRNKLNSIICMGLWWSNSHICTQWANGAPAPNTRKCTCSAQQVADSMKKEVAEIMDRMIQKAVATPSSATMLPNRRADDDTTKSVHQRWANFLCAPCRLLLERRNSQVCPPAMGELPARLSSDCSSK